MLYFILWMALYCHFGGEAYTNVHLNMGKFWLRKQLHVVKAAVTGSNLYENDLLALDFDGVVCDSSPESSVSAIKTMQDLWKLEPDDEEFNTVKDILMSLRPIIETGYENVLLARLALEEIRKSGGFDVELMLRLWGGFVRDSFVETYGVDKETLIDAFGKTRDDFIAEEFETWLDLNPIFPGIEKAFQKLHASKFELDNFFIITTKQERFVMEILKHKNLMMIPKKENLYGLENKIGSKADILLYLTKNRLKDGQTIHFIEDRVETLVKIADTPGLEKVNLYLVDWGYTTSEQKQVAKNNERIKIIGKEQFDEICERFCGVR